MIAWNRFTTPHALIGAALLIGLSGSGASAADKLVCKKCVDTGDIAKKAVSTSRIKPGAVNSSRIAPGAVAGPHIAPGAVTGDKIQDGTITGADIATGAVGAGNIAPGAVTTSRLGADVVLNSGRTAVEDCGMIDLPGSYVLLDDLPGPLGLEPDGGCLVIAADDVILDLNGFSIVGDGTGTGHGIFMDGQTNVQIRNGTLRDFPGNGVLELSTGGAGTKHHLANLRTIDNGVDGINLMGPGHRLTDCFSSGNGQDGFEIGQESVVAGNIAEFNTAVGILTNSRAAVTGNLARRNGAIGILTGLDSTVTGNILRRNTGAGIFAGAQSTVSGNTANFGFSDGIVVGGAIVSGVSVTVTGNTASFNSGSGILAGDGATVTGNTASSNGEDGINLAGNNLVVGNTAGGNNTSAGGFTNIPVCGTCTIAGNRTF